MSDDHHHDHGHAGHVHAPQNFGRAFAIGIGLNTAFVLVEAACGFVANSTALLADARHNLCSSRIMWCEQTPALILRSALLRASRRMAANSSWFETRARARSSP
jgi:hypothetical protein